MRIYGKRYVESTKTSVISVEGATFTILPVRTGLKLSFSLIFTPPLTFSLNLRLRKLLQDGPLKLTDNIKQKSFGNHNLVTTWWTTWLINWWNHWTNRKNPMGKPPLLSARTSERRLRSSSRRIAFFRNMPRRRFFFEKFRGIPNGIQKVWILANLSKEILKNQPKKGQMSQMILFWYFLRVVWSTSNCWGGSWVWYSIHSLLLSAATDSNSFRLLIRFLAIGESAKGSVQLIRWHRHCTGK